MVFSSASVPGMVAVVLSTGLGLHIYLPGVSDSIFTKRQRDTLPHNQSSATADTRSLRE